MFSPFCRSFLLLRCCFCCCCCCCCCCLVLLLLLCTYFSPAIRRGKEEGGQGEGRQGEGRQGEGKEEGQEEGQAGVGPGPRPLWPSLLVSSSAGLHTHVHTKRRIHIIRRFVLHLDDVRVYTRCGAPAVRCCELCSLSAMVRRYITCNYQPVHL